MAYLDDTGLAYFWGKIKAWANSVFALISHTHPSSDVTLMTGYSMPSSTSAISSGDTLNQAVGKLEKAISAADISNVVHRTGDENITGSKYFIGDYLESAHGSLVKGTAPSANRYGGYVFNGYSTTEDNNQALASLEYFYRANTNSYDVKIACYDFNDTTSNTILAYLYCGVDENGIPYLNATHTSAQRNADGDVLTRNWIPKDTRIVHTTGNETISGTKTFTGATLMSVSDNSLPTKPLLKLSAPNPYYALQISATDLTKGTAPGSQIESAIVFYGNAVSTYRDRVAMLRHFATTANVSTLEMRAIGMGAVDTGTACVISCSVDASGNAYTAAPTPAADDSSTKIATTAWASSATALVHTSGNETIAGEKTFTADFIKFKSSNYVRGATTHASSSSHLLSVFDANDRRLQDILLYSDTSGNSEVQFRLYNGNNTSATEMSRIHYFSYNNRASFSLCPISTYTNTIGLGMGGSIWKDVYAGNTVIQTSDERLKTDLSAIPDDVLSAWEAVDWRQFRYRDAVAEKGSGARLHTGLVAQELDRIFRARGLDVSAYGLFCYDEWEAAPAEVAESGDVVRPAVEAGSQYSLRYAEALCIEAAYMRRENARLKKRVADLEDRLAALELRLGSE